MPTSRQDLVHMAIGTPLSRIDGRAKVTGAARYGSDFGTSDRAAQAFLKTSSIARGRIVEIDEQDARAVRGVLDILTHRNVGDRIKPGKTFSEKGYMGTSIAPLASDRISHDGQIVALVVAETFEAAREAAGKLKIRYDAETPAATFGSPGLEAGYVTKSEGEPSPKVGDADAAFAAAEVKVDLEYETPTQHHNPIELFTTSCEWQGPKLTVWESSQNVYGFQNGLAEQLGIDPQDVRIISPFIGGAFGSRGSLTQRTAIVALAARKLKRAVTLETTRSQGFTVATYRAETRHRIRLAADRAGKLQALIHDGWEISSRPDDYKVGGVDASTRLYACPNVASSVEIVHADRNTPGFMRSPPEVPYLFALESAVDELAVALDMDPVELRRINDTRKEPIKGLPYTSRNLMACFDSAAKQFGWADRNAASGSMRDGDWLVGWGCATTMYPTQVAPAAARVILLPGGRVKVQTATHEIGTGILSAIALTVADKLGVAPDRVEVETGDSDLPPAPVAGGSNTTASVCNVVAMACDDIRTKLITILTTAADGPLSGQKPEDLVFRDSAVAGAAGKTLPLDKALESANGALEAYAENIPHGAPEGSIKQLYKGKSALSGGSHLKDRIQFAFGAQFVEVRVHSMTGELRVPRMVGAYSAGRIVNPKTAKSQLMGGQIWGISSALHEATEIDRRSARYVNKDLAEYMIPVNADITTVDTILVPEEDRQVNPLGIKGVGELGNVGLNAAVANAVYHATGLRLRSLPIRIEDVLRSPALRDVILDARLRDALCNCATGARHDDEPLDLAAQEGVQEAVVIAERHAAV